jgi:hypothetical protein
MQGSFDTVLDCKKDVIEFRKKNPNLPWPDIDTYYNIQEDLLPQRDFNRKDKDEIVKAYMKNEKNFGKSQVEETGDPLRTQKFATASSNRNKNVGRSTMLVPGKLNAQATLNM